MRRPSLSTGRVVITRSLTVACWRKQLMDSTLRIRSRSLKVSLMWLTSFLE